MKRSDLLLTAYRTPDFTWLDVLLANVDVRVTNQELKCLKLFADKVEKYHYELANQVSQELVQMRFEAQVKDYFTKHPVEHVGIADLVRGTTVVESEGEYDDEFFDAQDYFDPTIIDAVR